MKNYYAHSYELSGLIENCGKQSFLGYFIGVYDVWTIEVEVVRTYSASKQNVFYSYIFDSRNVLIQFKTCCLNSNL